MTVKYLQEQFNENYYFGIRFTKEDSYYLLEKFRKKDLIGYTNRLMKNLTELCNIKEHQNLFLKNKEKIFWNFEKPKISDIRYTKSIQKALLNYPSL